MKKFLVPCILLCIFVLATSVQAGPWIKAKVDITVEPHSVSGSVHNGTILNLYCAGYIYGVTEHSAQYKTQVQHWVEPGATMIVTVRTDARGTEHFSLGWAKVSCRYQEIL